MGHTESGDGGSRTVGRGVLLSIEEERRLAALRSFQILDTPPEVVFDDLVRLAAQVCGVPLAVVSLVDRNRSWFKARIGEQAQELPRGITLCPYPVAERQPIIVPDMRQDERFRELACVAGPPGFRFFAGYPLITRTGQALGALCVMDYAPKEPSELQDSAMRTLVGRIMAELELRKSALELQDLRRREREIEDRLLDRRALDALRLGADLQTQVTEQVARVSAALQLLSEEQAPAGAQFLAPERLSTLNVELKQALEACHSLGQRLTDGVLLQQGWGAALRAALESLGDRAAERCRIDCPAEPEQYLDYAGLYHLLEIARIAVQSILVTRETSRIAVSLSASDRGLVLSVEGELGTEGLPLLTGDSHSRSALMHHVHCLGASAELEERSGPVFRLRCTVMRSAMH